MDVVGGGTMFDFSLPDSWFNDMLNVDAAPYSGGGTGGVDSLEAIDLSTASDKEVIGFVRANYEWYKEKNLCHPPAIDDDDSLLRLDPWELDRKWFIICKMFGSDEKTRRGYWKEKDNEFTAIRGDQWQQPAQRRPVYIGFKRTLEFYMNDGTKTEWLMNEFAMIHQSDDGHFFLKEEVVISEVFKKDKDANLRPRMHPQNCPREMANENGEQGDREDEPNRDDNTASPGDRPPRHGAARSDLQASTGKRMRPDDDPSGSIRVSESEVWQQLTRVYVEVPKEAGSSRRKDGKKLVYAVCDLCDRVFRASSKNGTSSLRRHAEGCQCRHSSQARARDIVLQPGPSGGYAR
ncbi:hypothetical protein GQ55_3G450300 [Panicum hallii var. hallii]|uniref:NAC domain-containing protein n=1 Tax=Panicum hallii var. hallii TaxID=1504633 RepID=A0A2T7EIF9_9POAL|nr:hypothetical protein GQ55_3G450300 [Panicum hallii var. hallii]